MCWRFYLFLRFSYVRLQWTCILNSILATLYHLKIYFYMVLDCLIRISESISNLVSSNVQCYILHYSSLFINKGYILNKFQLMLLTIMLAHFFFEVVMLKYVHYSVTSNIQCWLVWIIIKIIYLQCLISSQLNYYCWQ